MSLKNANKVEADKKLKGVAFEEPQHAAPKQELLVNEDSKRRYNENSRNLSREQKRAERRLRDVTVQVERLHATLGEVSGMITNSQKVLDTFYTSRGTSNDDNENSYDSKVNPQTTLYLSKKVWSLGYGLNGEVIQVTCKGVDLAMKRIRQRPHLNDLHMREVEVLKTLSHCHIVQLVGTFYQAPYLGLLIWPVAKCDLATLLEAIDAESVVDWSSDSDDNESEDRGQDSSTATSSKAKENITENPTKDNNYLKAKFQQILSTYQLTKDDLESIMDHCFPRVFGCLTSAVAYLHRNNIRHKDIKPSNILISDDGMWLTDFGAAKDFTDDLTSSSESRERGTLRYCAPEVAQFAQSGRSADIFSLGCVFLEILVASSPACTLPDLHKLRPSKNTSYEANLDRMEERMELVIQSYKDEDGIRLIFVLLIMISDMLNADHDERPTAANVALQLAGYDEDRGELHCGRCSAWFRQDLLANFEELEALRRMVRDRSWVR